MKILRIIFTLIILAGLSVPFTASPVKADVTLTQTFYPILDGTVSYQLSPLGLTWANIHGGIGGGAIVDSTSASVNGIALVSGSSVNTWTVLTRGYWFFDTSNLTAGATVTSAVLQLYVSSQVDGFGSAKFDVVASNSTSNTTLIDADYFNYDNITAFNSTNLSSLTTSSYNSLTLNAAGIASINTTAITRFATLSGWDRTDIPPTWAISRSSSVNIQTSEGTYKPKLVITYTLTGSGAVTTNDAIAVGSTTATLAGTLDSLVGSPSASVSFQYGTTSSYGQSTSELGMTAIGGFNIAVSGLSYSQVYHFRAVARFGSAYAYGADNVFTTLAIVGATTDIRIINAHMFSDYITVGDRLLCVEAINKYTGYYPNQRAGMWFTIRLLDVDNITVLGASPLSNWGDRPSSIYLNPTVAASLIDGSAYTLEMVGNLSLSGVSTNYTLQTFDWFSYADVSLDSWAISTAINMEISDGRSDYLVELTDRGTVIADPAGGFFSVGIPGIPQQRPELFTTSQLSATLTPSASSAVWDKPDADPAGWRSYVGTSIANDFDNLALPFGITGKDFGVGIVLFALVLIMITVVMGTGGVGALGALLIALPILWLSTYWRVMPVAVISIFAIIMGWFAIRQLWIKTI